MEKSEPALVPEWLRSTGNVTGGGSSTHNHAASSSSHSDGLLSAHNTRNRASRSISDLDSPRSSFLDRTSSSNSRRSSSSNGSAKHAYSSFSRGNREREKERSSFVDHWDRDGSDPFGNILTGRGEKDILRRSHSMVSRKQSDILPRRVAVDSKNGGHNNHYNGNGVHSSSGIGSSIHKAVFEKDFPSLGTEERQGVPDIIRVSSPGLSTTVQSLPIGNSALIGREGWTSALAEVPNMIGSSSMGPSSVQQATTSGSGTSSTMAEAVAQAPSRASTAPQVSVKTQRLEELAIKQSRQLIPVTPSMSKPSVLGSDKSKPKKAVRTTEMIVVAKSGQQQPSPRQVANQPLRGGHVKSDTPKASHGKFQVLKPVWENGISPTPKDVSSTTNASSKVANSQFAVAPPVASAPLQIANNPKLSTVEKRPSTQAQSRNDFFNLVRKKSMNAANGQPDASPSPTAEKSGETVKEVVSAPVSPRTVENGDEVTSNGDSGGEAQKLSDVREKDLSSDVAVYPDEEEAAFLRSLGWKEREENDGEEECLTQEEINAFYQEYNKLRPEAVLRHGAEASTQPDSHATNMGDASSELSSSDSGSEV